MDRELTWALWGGGGVLALAVLSAKPKTTQGYRLTDVDKLWLARAVEREGAPKEDVAKTLVNLFAYLRQNPASKYKTLASLIRAYATPVNPSWFPNGKRHLAYLKKLTDAAEIATENKRANDRKNVYSIATSFAPDTLNAVKAATENGASVHNDWTDYAAPGIDASNKYQRRTPDKTGQNTFWSRAPGWGGYTVSNGSIIGNLRLTA